MTKQILTGNEAVAVGALRAGVRVATGNAIYGLFDTLA
jgi:pyruvate/2-oxoacid:ferredoxin oxidoreductase alpha subunit